MWSSTLAAMGHLFKVFQTWLVLVVGRFGQRLRVLIWLSSLLCAFGVAGCAPAVPASRPIPKERVFNVCWKPPELGPGVYFDFPTESGLAASTSGEEDPAHIRYVFKYAEDGPTKNLRLLPLSRVDAWCPHIPQPSILEVPAFEPEPAPCPVPVSIEERLSDARLLFGQTSDVPIRSPFFCDKQPRVAYSVEELISLRARNVAFHLGFENAYVLGKAVTIGAAESQAVINKSDSWLKRALTSDPGSLEQIQQRMADALNTIEPLPEYDDPILDGLVMAGYQAGFEQGKFEVEAKLFAIDVGVMLVEFALLEVALGPLGGARLLASAVSKGAKALTTAVKRLENIPIFIPIATNGVGDSFGLARSSLPFRRRRIGIVWRKR
ncbi:MAG: hypothetical protein IPM54_33785 [Polyangiaceae bacterium]|nr:hypothetical protein [Polyangiaceae bacterium]